MAALPEGFCSISSQVDKQMQALVASHGPVHVLVNCAGFSVAHYFEDGDQATFESLMRVNYLGAVAITRALLPFMRKGSSLSPGVGGCICFVSSMAGQVSGVAVSKFGKRRSHRDLNSDRWIQSPEC